MLQYNENDDSETETYPLQFEKQKDVFELKSKMSIEMEAKRNPLDEEMSN